MNGESDQVIHHNASISKITRKAMFSSKCLRFVMIVYLHSGLFINICFIIFGFIYQAE